MKSVIYKAKKKQDSYLYVELEDDFSRVPETLLSILGTLEFVMSIELNADRKLARADVNQVMDDLKQQGFYLQMPDESEKLALAGAVPASNPIPQL